VEFFQIQRFAMGWKRLTVFLQCGLKLKNELIFSTNSELGKKLCSEGNDLSVTLGLYN